MFPTPLPLRCRETASGGFALCAAPRTLPKDPNRPAPRIWFFSRRLGTVCGASIRTPRRRAGGLRAVGTWLPDHDVSGPGSQPVGRGMQPITAMMPVWQCGHARKDCPVNVSNRSR